MGATTTLAEGELDEGESMTDQPAAAVRGKTIRLTWTEGPTKGLTHEHVFHQDGTVEWHDVANRGSPPKPQQASRPKEKPKYAASTSRTVEW